MAGAQLKGEVVGGDCCERPAERVDLAAEPSVARHDDVGALRYRGGHDVAILAVDTYEERELHGRMVMRVVREFRSHLGCSSAKRIGIEALEVGDQIPFDLTEDRYADHRNEQAGVEQAE